MDNHQSFLKNFSVSFFEELSQSFDSYLTQSFNQNSKFEFKRVSQLRRTGCFKYANESVCVEGEFIWENRAGLPVKEITYWHQVTNVESNKPEKTCSCSSWTWFHFGCQCGVYKMSHRK